MAPRTLAPRWGAARGGAFALRVPRHGGRLRVQLWDHDDQSDHDFLGQVEFLLGGATGQGGPDAIVPHGSSYQLLPRRGFVGRDRVKGRLSLAVEEDGLHAELSRLFREIDDDGSGCLDRDEVRELLHKLNMSADNEKLDSIMHEMDADGEGEIELQEFMWWWKKSGREMRRAMTALKDEMSEVKTIFDEIDGDGSGTGGTGGGIWRAECNVFDSHRS